jgi:hypothetical protein
MAFETRWTMAAAVLSVCDAFLALPCLFQKVVISGEQESTPFPFPCTYLQTHFIHCNTLH